MKERIRLASVDLKKMIALAAIFAVPLIIASPAKAEPPALDQLMTDMQAAYEKTADIKAHFAQDTMIKSMSKKQHEEGTVYFKKPRRMLWDYSKPKVKKLIINASKAWFYIPQDNAVYVQDSEKLFKSQLTVRFLNGIGNLRKDFDITYVKDNPVDGQGNYRLLLKARTADLGVDHLRMTVDQDTLQIIECSFTDTYGNDTRIYFRNMKVNSGLPDRLFNFKPPAKAEVFPVQ